MDMEKEYQEAPAAAGPDTAPAREDDAYIAEPSAGRPAREDASPVVVIARTTLNYIVIAVVFLLLGVFIGAFAAYRVERDRRSWVSDAIAAAMADQADTFAGLAAAAAPPSLENPNSRFTLSSTSDHALGADDAPITMIEFGDFNCGFCGRFHSETFPQIQETYGDQIRFIYRDYPILAESSVTAAVAARCAGEQGVFWDYHDLLYENQGQFNQSGGFAALAQELDLDIDTFNTCVEEQRYLSSVIEDYQEGQTLGIRGTPAFFINGRPISGAQPFEVFAAMIEEELAASEDTAEDTTAS